MQKNHPALTSVTVSIILALANQSGGCTTGVTGDQSTPPGDGTLVDSYPVGTELFTTATVNVRKKPTEDAEILEVLPPRTKVVSAISRGQNGYYGVSTSTVPAGWISEMYLTSEPKGPSNNAEFDRQAVYDLVKDRHRSDLPGAAEDLLDGGLTTQKLVNAVGWIATHNPPDWGFSVMSTGHHTDPAAHTGGFAIDLFANASANDQAMINLVNQNPFVVEVGLAGDYRTLESSINSPGKCSFSDNEQTHLHIAVVNAYCSP
jgi:hypothetical protein